ncbi:MAG: non-canonical purine NTP pyrophosphatase [Clostridia bacterium]|nr:non-canonical purine NTP pyrophosphatase [Clostridia bacterium]
MTELLYGTSNKAKIQSMRHMLRSIEVSLANNDTFDLSKVIVEENGNTPLENASIKALAFYDEFSFPVFSCDTGLYLKDIPDKYQPGVQVRRANGNHMNDEEMIQYYANLAAQHGGEITAYYQNAICLVMNKHEIYTRADESLHSEEFIIAAHPHKNRTPGYPLDSLSVHIESGKFYMDLKSDLNYSYVLKKDLSEGFSQFFIDSIGAKYINI